MTASRLAALLDQMDAPGSGLVMVGPRIFTLEQQRDMAQLLVDMADALTDRNLIDYEHGTARRAKWRTAAIPESVAAALLARFAALDEKAGGA